MKRYIYIYTLTYIYIHITRDQVQVLIKCNICAYAADTCTHFEFKSKRCPCNLRGLWAQVAPMTPNGKLRSSSVPPGNPFWSDKARKEHDLQHPTSPWFGWPLSTNTPRWWFISIPLDLCSSNQAVCGVGSRGSSWRRLRRLWLRSLRSKVLWWERLNP